MNELQHIIKKAIQGNTAAQRAIYDQYATRWYMTSLRYGKNKMEAEDIFQEALINIFNRLQSFDHNRGAFTTWSTRVIINSAMTYLKKNNWSNSMAGLEDTYNTEIESETVYDKLSAKELTAHIQRLPLGYRLVFNLYAIEGFTHKEIAEQLDISIGTSKSQLFKARRELQRTLESQLTSSSNE